MTILKITIEDEQAVLLKNLLKDVSYIKKIEEETTTPSSPAINKQSQLARIKLLLEEAEGKNLFKDIEDPVEWQREIRKEWDRDL
jgi:hypothetical protein